MKIFVINGPNLNMLDYRNSSIYGIKTIDEINENLKEKYKDINFEFFVSNCEGKIIDSIQKGIKQKVDGIIINPGAYSHYSYAIHDALDMYTGISVEVHLSDVKNREEFRSNLVTGQACSKIISGQRDSGYISALEYIISEVN